ncbi:MAG: hypothetical protein JXJ20_14585, partial [Anaerolineae bacterium]|nr:hypothetical protein [Anaerolineae bacterium]
PAMIALIGNNAGTATVTLTVNDGVHPDVSVPFQVTVTAANQPPVIQTVGEQVVDEGASLTVPMQVTDPDGDPVMLAAVSDHPEIATASASGLDVIIGGVVPGTATLTVDADDGQGGMASTSFMVTVKGLNSPPVIGPIVEQALTVGEQITLPLDITDLDGDAVIVTAIPQDGGVVAATVVDNNSVVLDGLAEGTTAVDLTADDARGGITTATFTVAVSSAAPAFDLMAYPVLPEITPQMANMLELTYQGGLSLGNQAGAFSKVGDELMDGPDFMTPFASDTYNLGSYGSLQDTIDFYRGTPVRDDTTINSFNVDSVAAEPGFGLDMLSGTAPGVPPCDMVGGTNLSCEYLVTHPSIALISFSAANVTYMDPAEFRNELQTLVFDSMSTYGVIPVLATVPADASATTEQLTEYNRTIVEVANDSGVPLWNLWRAIAERGITDPAGTSPDGPAIFTDPALSFGVNVRNLTALQVLEAVRQAANIP